MVAYGPDLSAYQSGANAQSIAGRVLFFKLTEGVGYLNPCAARHYQQARAAGKFTVAYHFARPSRNSAAAEAAYFVAKVRQVCPDVGGVALDWEDPGATGNVGWAKSFLDACRSQLGRLTLIYMSQAVENAADWRAVAATYPLWVARYADMAVTNGFTPRGSYGRLRNWQAPWAWQFTADGRLPGYTGALDLNIIYGQLSTGGTMTPDDVWNFNQNGTLMRDRIQGIDEAANHNRGMLDGGIFGVQLDGPSGTDTFGNKITNIFEAVMAPYADADGISGAMRDRIAWIDKRIRADGVQLAPEAITKIQAAVGTPQLTDQQVQALAVQLVPALVQQLAPALLDVFKQQFAK